MKHCLVIVETRPLPNIREIVENHIEHTGWPLMFFCGPGNANYVHQKLKGLDVTLLDTREIVLNETAYNRLLTSRVFWEAIPYEKVLIFQHDSRLLRKGIDEFLQWDYVGAPWSWQHHGGNGGLSLRTKAAMLEVIDFISYAGEAKDGNEDVYFCRVLRSSTYKLAPREVCEKFSCEAIFKLGTFGVHAIEKHLTAEQCEQIYNQYKQWAT